VADRGLGNWGGEIPLLEPCLRGDGTTDGKYSNLAQLSDVLETFGTCHSSTKAIAANS
jgi:hypothetical protein